MSRGRRSPFKLKLRKGAIQSISAVLLLGLAGLILLSYLGKASGVGSVLQTYAQEYFGWGGVLTSGVLVSAALYMSKLKWKFARPHVFVGLIGVLLSLLALSSGLQAGSGGEVGQILWTNLDDLLSIGAYFFYLILLLIFIVVLFDTSLDRSIEVVFSWVGGIFGFFNHFILRREAQVKSGFDADKLPFKTSGVDNRPVLQTKGAEPAKTAGLGTQVVSNLPDNKVWEYPPLDLLADSAGGKADRGDIKANAQIIEKTLESFGIQARVVEVNLGPAVTQYALEIALGTKLTKITALGNDIALALAAPTGTVRIEAPIPGRSLVGIEAPNKSPEFVSLKQLLTSEQMQSNKSQLAIGLGLDVAGKPSVGDLDRMPHLLIAGATGSGKSVMINSIIATYLFRTTPNEVKFILVDPKVVELNGFNGIPNLLTPVITEPEKVLSALKWATAEMERRYQLFATAGSRNIASYNEASGFQALPYIVIVIDELADLMMFAPAEIEDAVVRLAQKSRATGIHLILATQRPSVDVITGLIKANIPARMAFNVTSQIDSRVILDTPGAEKLLGRGDMLYLPPDLGKPVRVQGVFVSEPELQRLIEFLRKQGEPQYQEEVTTMPVKAVGRAGVSDEEKDELFEEAVGVVTQYDRASASLLQRRLKVGYARAARILDELEGAGIVSASDGSKAREVLVRSPGGGEVLDEENI
ncbi:MAG TPA: DNA translocase FtsK [Patescibacteria group bacterium]|nr:DNA translocase FtsK [Patescibacteria group bacterium]